MFLALQISLVVLVISASLADITTEASGFKGVDYTGIDLLTLDASTCLVSQYNASFAAAQGSSQGVLNTNICGTLQNLKTSGISTIDVSLFPCPNCDTAAKQLSDLNSYLKANCPTAWSGRIWLLLTNYEVWNTPWHDVEYNKNRDIMNEYVDECAKQGLKCGVFSTSPQWFNMFGRQSATLSQDYSYPADKGLPLWDYPGTKNDSFTFTSYGNWKTPYAQQQVAGNYYSQTCGSYWVGLDWAPVV